jgi:RNA polymerase sigma-70 factor (ECF subfamily)
MVASRRIDDFLRRRPTSFRLWLRRKALEKLIDLRRYHVLAEKRSQRREVSLPDESSLALAASLFVERPSHILRRQELAARINRVISQLSENDREILLCRHIEQLTNGEIAELLEIDPVTASKRYGRAIRRLREKMIELGLLSETPER